MKPPLTEESLVDCCVEPNLKVAPPAHDQFIDLISPTTATHWHKGEHRWT